MEADVRIRITADGFDETIAASRTLILGRDPGCDVWLANVRVSRHHAGLRFEASEGWVLEDLGSTHGTFHDGVRIKRVLVNAAATVLLGGDGGALVALQPLGAPILHGRQRIVRIGRAPENDIVVADLVVSRRHAELVEGADGEFEVVDLNSYNGTFVNGRRVERARLNEQDIVAVGRHSFMYATGGLVEYVEPPEATLEVSGLTVRLPGGDVLVDNVSFAVRSGTFLAIAGLTGAGKSTLVKALAGFRWPDGGVIRYNGRDFYGSLDELRSRIGYVPQDLVLHEGLTLRQALDFGAELRLPPDLATDVRRARVAEVMDELGLAGHGATRIRNLSGGQKRRASAAVELLPEPAVLLLDEPTSGLDPHYVRSVMKHLDAVAERGRIVVVVTHNLDQIALCDQILLLAPGGRMSYLGRPEDMLAYFGHSDYADVFEEMEKNPQRDWTGEFLRRSAAPPFPASTSPLPGGRTVGRAHARTQLSTLVRRQFALVMSDPRSAWFLGATVALPGLAIVALAGANSLRLGAVRPDARLLLAALVIVAVSVAAAGTAREVVKERAIFQQERAHGVTSGAYLASKVAVFGLTTVAQTVLLVLIGTLRAGGPSRANLPVPPLLELTFDVCLAALAAMAMGLLLSALVRSSDQAVALVAVVFVAQWLFSGAAIDLHDKPVMPAIAYVTTSNWGLAAAASTSDLPALERCGPAAIEGRPCDERWAPGFGRWLTSVLALLWLTGAFLTAAWVVIERRDAGRKRSP